jgi:hypothetical protein
VGLANSHPVHGSVTEPIKDIPVIRTVRSKWGSTAIEPAIDIIVHPSLHALQNFRLVFLVLFKLLDCLSLTWQALGPTTRKLDSLFLVVFSRVVIIVEGSIGVVPSAQVAAAAFTEPVCVVGRGCV